MYAPEQVPVAQAIRRFRDLDMPLEDIRQVLEAGDTASRNAAIVAHLERMQEQLARTQLTVASLQALLAATPASGVVDVRPVPAMWVLSIAERVAQDDCAAWLDVALAELHDAAPAAGLRVTGPDGALYDDDFFFEGAGVVTAHLPVDAHDGATTAGTGRTQLLHLAATDVAVMAHDGPFDELDRTYGALGTWVTTEGIAAPGPIRETYFSDDKAEVAWPVSQRNIV
jgi:effector-binding domain-containing protein